MLIIGQIVVGAGDSRSVLQISDECAFLPLAELWYGRVIGEEILTPVVVVVIEFLVISPSSISPGHLSARSLVIHGLQRGAKIGV